MNGREHAAGTIQGGKQSGTAGKEEFMAMRKKTARQLAQARATQRARKEAAREYTDDMRYVQYGVLQKDGQDTIVRIGDPQNDGDSFEQNLKAFIELMKANPPAIKNGSRDVYGNVFELYEDGRAHNKVTTTNEELKAWHKDVTANFREIIESRYDHEFPEHAANMNDLVQKFVSEIRAKANIPVQLPEGAVFNFEYFIDGIRRYLETAKQQIIETGEAKSVIGWGVEEGILTYPIGFPKTKYRFGRAVAEVASIINAPFIITGGEGWVRNKDGKRTGDEVLQADVILPDGSVAVFGYIEFRRIDCPLTFKDMVVKQANGGEYAKKQFLFPNWGFFPNTGTAAA